MEASKAERVRATVRAVQTFVPIMPRGLSHNDLEAYVTYRDGKPHASVRKGPGLKAAEDALWPWLERARPETPLAGPIRETIKLCYRIPKGSKHVDGEPYTETPDFDNSIKVLHDLCERLGYYANDAQIFQGSTLQVWAERPGIFLRFEQVRPQLKRGERR